MKIVHIARCPEHGLHGARDACFECGSMAEQVPMVEIPRAEHVHPDLTSVLVYQLRCSRCGESLEHPEGGWCALSSLEDARAVAAIWEWAEADGRFVCAGCVEAGGDDV